MNDHYFIIDDEPYHYALQRVAKLSAADGGYSAASSATNVVTRFSELKDNSLTLIVNRKETNGKQPVYICKWRLTMHRPNKCEYGTSFLSGNPSSNEEGAFIYFNN
jgi:hypothetical protein